MAGQASTLGQGSIAALGLTLALTGSAITSAAGDVVGSERGIQAAFAAGSVTQSASVALTGSAVTSGSGTVTGSTGQQTLVGQSITSAQGITGPVGNDVTAHLSGVEADFATGTVDSGGQALTGSVGTFSAGSLTLDLTIPLSGSESATGIGTVVPSQDAEDTAITSHQGSATGSHDVPLTGAASTLSAGTVTPSGDAFAALTGEASTTASGSVGFDQQFALTGSSITSAQENVGAPGGATLTGSSVSVVAGDVFLDGDRTLALSGEAFTAHDGSCFASPLAFVAGESVTVSAQSIGPINVALTGSAITSDAGYVLAPSRGVTPAGNPVKGKGRKRTTVVIDDEEFEVSGPEEALALLEQAKEAAKEQAATVLDRASKAEKKPARKVLQDARKSLTTPEIEGPEEIQAQIDTMKREIAELYESALKTVEIGTLLRRQEEEEEEALLLLLA